MTYLQMFFYVTAAGGGVVLGLIYFGGLWITVKKVNNARRPYLLLASSFLVRTALVLAGFYLLLLYNWIYLVLAMITFIVTRHFLIQRKGKSSELIYG
ncbi:ATP synthase subunit I [Aliifodinibius salicampi]|uniref:ATP synthase subunit I n=1 Tax=Fodinibius salicampi TaxID=1920655 RepID=A0ABT3PU81_9BACT|nr:ATP synthase subunit I [Fodinibius salicampi]MCW9711417.1 ATP synthase subunit I [Fodinibius salicampi]